MNIRSIDVDSIRQRVQDGDLRPLSHQPSGISLAAACELACSNYAWKHERRTIAVDLLNKWGQVCRPLGRLLRILDGSEAAVPPAFATPPLEFRALSRRSDILDTEYTLFMSRFKRSLIAKGFSTALALALSKAFGEMVDNVVEHSAARDGDGFPPAVAGFHVEDLWMTFAVADTGEGILTSLRRNPRWQHLVTAEQTLRAAVCDRASRRVDAEGGAGFSQVHRSLADLNGHLRFRSDDSLLTLTGRREARHILQRTSAPMRGFQLSVSCALRTDLHERPLVD